MLFRSLVLEAQRMGFDTVLLPRRNADKLKRTDDSPKLVGVTTVSEAISSLGARRG